MGGGEAGTVPGIDKSRLITSQDDCPYGSSDSPTSQALHVVLSDTAPWAKTRPLL